MFGKKHKCRDCKECHRPALSKLGRNTLRVGLAYTTLGASEVVQIAGRSVSEICPICKHRMGLHEDRKGGVAR